MTDRNTVVFADYDHVVGGSTGPTIDGFFDKDYLVTAEPVETGYVGGALLTLGDAGIAPVIFKAVRNDITDRLVMAFLCRFSQPVTSGSGAEDDEIFIAIKPTFGGNDDKIRLILINPVGASGAAGGSTVPSAPPGSNIRTDSPPNATPLFYKPDGLGSWTPASPTGIEVKVRSWTSDPALGAPEIAWSVEVSVPRTAAAGGGAANWIDITNHFGIYFAVTKIVGVGAGSAASQFRFPLDAPNFPGYSDLLSVAEIPFGHGFIPAITTPPMTETPKGVYFMGGPAGIGCRPSGTSGTLGSQIQAANNQVAALLGNDGNTTANQVQVEFLMAHWGLPSGNPNFWTRPDGLLPVKIPAGGQNVANGASGIPFASNDWDLDNVTPNYKGSGLTQRGFFDAHPHQCMWAQASALTSGVNFRQSSVRRNMDFVSLSEVERDAVVSGEGYEKPSNGTAEHDFILQSFCRKMVIQQIIENIESIDDDTKQLLGTALRGDHDADGRPDIATDMVRSSMSAGGSRGQQYQDVVVYIWITMGYRVTSDYVVVSGKQYPLLDNGSGSFGFIATHKGEKDNFSWSFAGPGMGKFGPGCYGLKVPHKGSATIKTRISAEPRGPVGDERTDLPTLDATAWIPPTKNGPKREDSQPDGGKDDGKFDNGGCFPVILALAMIPGLGLATYLTS